MSEADQYLTPQKQALVEEFLSLGTRIDRLGNEIKTAVNTPAVPHIDVQRMHIQLQAMNLYSLALKQRIEFTA